jgi:hypothetical protein
MRNTISLLLLLALLACQLTPVDAESYPIEIINSRYYEGKYIATQSGVLDISQSQLLTISTAWKVVSSPFSMGSPIVTSSTV